MKKFAFWVPALAVASLGAVPDAVAHDKWKSSKSRPPADRIYSKPDAHGWYPNDLTQLKFGSAIWWDVYIRQNGGRRGG